MHRLRALAVIVVAVTLTAAAPVLADDTTTVPTTEPPSTVATVPAPGETAPSTTDSTIPPQPPAPSTTAPVVDPEAGGDAPPVPVPVVDVTIPPRTADASPTGNAQTALPGRAVTVDVKGAQTFAELAKQRLQIAQSLRQGLEKALAVLRNRVATLDVESRDAVSELVDARADLKTRAVNAYVRDGVDDVPDPGSAAELDRQQLQGVLIGAVLERDGAAILRYKRASAAANKRQTAVANSITVAESQLTAAASAEQQANLDTRHASLALAVTAAGGSIVIEGFVFPVSKPYTFTDTFGAPRLAGTPYAHWHMGCDVAAAEGQTLFAAERGVITQILAGGLGGNGLFLKGESGTSYYYAHLSRFADGLKVGQVVEAGDVVGFVGHTGDAVGPHLHFEVHPGGGPAVNPYPILKASADYDAAAGAAAAGTTG